jgi:hypothetical protein
MEFGDSVGRDEVAEADQQAFHADEPQQRGLEQPALPVVGSVHRELNDRRADEADQRQGRHDGGKPSKRPGRRRGVGAGGHPSASWT